MYKIQNQIIFELRFVIENKIKSLQYFFSIMY